VRSARLVIITLAAAVGASPTFDPYQGPKPIAVWVQTDPWLWVIGSDSPRAVLYEDGELVFAKVRGRRDVVFRHRKLGPAELDAFKVRVAAAAGLSGVQGQYDLAPDITDQPETLLYARSGAHEVATRIYGVEAEDATLPAAEFQPVPKELHELHRLLATLADAGSTEWQPRYIEVMLSPLKQVPAVAHWPSDWPGLKSDRAFKRQDQYSIYLDSGLKPKLDALLAQQNGRGGIELGGTVWGMRTRMAFPSERVWGKAFDAAAR
jgi:hypothetical protein